MLVNRENIPDSLHVLQKFPTIPITEMLRWKTKTFIAADLSESREPWLDAPAITIQFNYRLSRFNRPWLESIIGNDLLWLIPYLPHMTVARLERYYTPSQVANYPYGQYAAYMTQDHIFYRSIDAGDGYSYQDNTPDRWDDLAGKQVWICPCWEAYIDRDYSYQFSGPCLDGDIINIKFRLTGGAEQQQYYEVYPPYSFQERLVVPYNVARSRNQLMINNRMTVPHSYAPVTKQPDETRRLNVKYHLHYGDDVREDYELRGAFNWAKGGALSQDWLGDFGFWRLEGDRITIDYTNSYAEAKMTLRNTI